MRFILKLLASVMCAAFLQVGLETVTQVGRYPTELGLHGFGATEAAAADAETAAFRSRSALSRWLLIHLLDMPYGGVSRELPCKLP